VDCTLHRAFDVCKDPFAALEAAKALKVYDMENENLMPKSA
jgi:copper homeostasis protein CutC